MNCSICGKEITTSISVRRGIGPLCYEKLKREEKRGNSLPGEIVLTTDMGGEIEELIKETALKSYYCLGLPKDHLEIVGAWHGYPHDGGLLDKEERKHKQND